jgi:hypothetical protein
MVTQRQDNGPGGPRGAGWRKKHSGSSGAFLTLQVGDIVEGTYLGTTLVHNVPRHVVRETDGSVWTLPDHVQLRTALEDTTEGAEVYIECTGEQEIRGRSTPMKTYNVYTRDRPEDSTASAKPSRRRDDDADDVGVSDPPDQSDVAF